ncbi:hypothetical protein INS49_003206 [Diaporthe citri]|uniref:uncharacterized protein n=1 Tax=Diaporthe citri TaxID=83186 RepID=UPI001C82099C|nr:uncharacterized protein INS49_003206 [Diaporthe citri]KAG6368987.1 hypothetical protein INS49_003206 [Diaporthe citri]
MQLFDRANNAKAGDANPASESTRDNEVPSTVHRPSGFNSFDETIVLSFYLVKALQSLYNPKSLKLDEQSSVPVGPPLTLDSGTILIIFSCYFRMSDLFMDRLGALRSALDTTTATKPTAASSLAATTTPSFSLSNVSASNGASPNGAALHLPTLSACGCPLEGYPVLRLRMTLELVEESGQSSLMPVVSPQALSAREQAVHHIINETRMDLRRHRRVMVI